MPLELFLGQPDDESLQSCGIMLPGVRTGFRGTQELVIVECDEHDRGGSIYSVPLDEVEAGELSDPTGYMTAEHLVEDIAQGAKAEHDFLIDDGVEARISAVHLARVIVIPIPYNPN